MTMKKSWFLKIFNGAAIALILASVFVLLSVVLTPAGQVPQVMGFSVFGCSPAAWSRRFRKAPASGEKNRYG